MDGPPPPRDVSLHNIIDKLAEFVARNGPEFEMITKQKQQGNPKFEFLYGGEFANYYQYRVHAEQAYLKQQQSYNQSPSNMNNHMQHQQHPHFTQGPPPNLTSMPHMQHQQLQNSHDSTGMPYNVNQPPPGHQMWNQNSSTVNNTQSATAANGMPALNSQIEALNMQQNGLREQIHQSEANLTAQHTALKIQQIKQIEEAIATAQSKQLDSQAQELNINLEEFASVLQPIIDSCTKDSISAGKNWILQHSSDSAKNNVVLQYLLKKALMSGSTFQQKLHLIYLVNDILHHCVRKNVNDLKNCLENVVIPMFCSAVLIANTEQQAKLTKLLSLWESKAKFFDACVISKLQSPDSSMTEYKNNLQNLHLDIVSKFAATTKATLDSYQKQHQVFIQHATQQINQIEQQKQQLEQQIQSSARPSANASSNPKQIPSLLSKIIPMPQLDDSDAPPGVDDNSNMHFTKQQTHINPFASNNNNKGGGNTNNNNSNNNFSQVPPTHKSRFSSEPASENFLIPDLSKPPPGFLAPTQVSGQLPPALQQQLAQIGNIPTNLNNDSNSGNSNISVDLMAVTAAIQLVQQQQQQQKQLFQQQQQQLYMPPEASLLDDELPPPPPPMTEEDQIPTAAYYDLPAGLMVPLIRLEDYNYKPLDASLIRLPHPAPQSERLTNALTAFYSLPTHDRPRDNEGWEKLGLYEYYKVKNAARKQKEEELKSGEREKSRSPTPVESEKPKPKKNNKKRCYQSKSRSRSRSPAYKSHSRSPSRSSRDTRTRDTVPRSNRYSQRERSPAVSRRSSPPTPRDREGSNSSSRDRPERNTNRREQRSPTPPSFFNSNFVNPNEFIEESNKGHQMLMKMGWAGSGSGLGNKNQGIEEPISGGEVRDRRDMYKGVGISMNDPFENFRKNKGAAFIHRMRARDEKS